MNSTSISFIIQELEKLGITHEKMIQITDALAQGDGRALLHELLMRGLWENVVDESLPQPLWVEQWLALGAEHFPIINTGSLQRLINAGIDLHDLTDVVRSAQILTIYNIAQQLDQPTLALGWETPEQATLHLQCSVGEHTEKNDFPKHAPYDLYELHSDLLERDPSGRYGEPRTLEWRQLHSLPFEIQKQIQALLEAHKMSQAAMLWKQHIGGDLAHCLSTVQLLAGQINIHN